MKILSIIFFASCLAIFAGPAEHLQNAAELERSVLQATTSDEAQSLRAQAIQEYESAHEGGLANGGLYGKLGGLYLQQGDLAHGILNLKKALVFTPRDKILKANLALARNRRMDHFAEEEDTGAVRILAFLHYDIGYPARVNLAIGAWILLCAMGVVMLWKRPLWLVTLAVFCGIAAILFGSSAAVTCHNLRQNRMAVVAAAETTPRKGDGDAYAPATTAVLHAGTEVTIQRERGDWSYVILPGNIPAWLKTQDLAK